MDPYPEAEDWAIRWALAVCLIGCVALVALTLVGCGTLQSDYVEADASTYAAIAPVYSAYTSADQSLSAEQRERRYRLLRAWSARIEEGRNVSQQP